MLSPPSQFRSAQNCLEIHTDKGDLLFNHAVQQEKGHRHISPSELSLATTYFLQTDFLLKTGPEALGNRCLWLLGHVFWKMSEVHLFLRRTFWSKLLLRPWGTVLYDSGNMFWKMSEVHSVAFRQPFWSKLLLRSWATDCFVYFWPIFWKTFLKPS